MIKIKRTRLEKVAVDIPYRIPLGAITIVDDVGSRFL